ncbi:T9SS type A sorting domain-containing protein [Pontibacter sp. SGAir0037]|uniref:T9SS type A sorting domain-containing protein n=1 Tax=Pontibacter sp. SGAir0037 TaxID=2571030 RepID=UPI0010CCE2B2|nr:T9SS type A sorting domain-containing protein [Pontibacter sp. SGAir0037]QCR21537.1 sugar dehydrogenase [Pontibacter sp. SGAir0037]
MKIKRLLNKPLLLFTLATGAAIPLAQAQTTPPAATVTVKIDVPESMRAAPFNVDRFATVPKDFSLEVYARVSGVRFMAVAPNGDLFASVPGESDNKIKLIRANENGTVQDFDYATGLQHPHDIVFHQIGDIQYMYVAEKNQISRFVYKEGETRAGAREVIISNLPDESLPELKGNYGHVLKNIAIDSNHKIYVSIASTCNACEADTKSDPKRGAIYQYNADGSNRRLFAEGIRNAEGLAFLPGTNELWVVGNNRDWIPYPHNDNTGRYGQVLQAYVDNNPPEIFTKVRDGGNYGWPFCNPDGSQGMNNMPYNKDYDTNKDGEVDCDEMDRATKGIAAHSAPLGLIFTQGTQMPQLYRNGAIVALHGSWNRDKKTGYKVIYYPWNSQTQTPGDHIDLVGGFLNSDSTVAYARPVDVAVGTDGSLFISDDATKSIYRLTYSGPVASAKNDELERALTIYPVPAEGDLKIALNGLKSKEVRITMTNAQSANVVDETRAISSGENNLLVDTSKLANGVYFLSIFSDGARVVRRVVVRNK